MTVCVVHSTINTQGVIPMAVYVAHSTINTQCVIPMTCSAQYYKYTRCDTYDYV